jgi:hypothetical protein
MRDARDVLVEAVDDLAEARLDHGPEGDEQPACSGVEAEKAGSDAKIVAVRR